MSIETALPPSDDEVEARQARTDAAMAAAGEDVTEPGTVDYFNTDRTERVYLPDRGQWFDIKKLNEGGRRQYLNQTNREVKIHRGTGDAGLRSAPGDDKFILLKLAIVGFNLVKGGQPFPFNPRNVEEVLTEFPPEVIDIVEKAVRKLNPWLMADATVEQIDEQIEQLQEMRKVAAEREAGKDAFSAK